jgi:hypothetical protein
MKVIKRVLSDAAMQHIAVPKGSVVLSARVEDAMSVAYILDPETSYDTISVGIFQSTTDYIVDSRAVKYIGSFQLNGTGWVRHCFTDLA